MTLEPTHRSIRPYAGRTEEYAAAMARAEAAAEPKPVAADYSGRTRSGWVRRSDGSLFTPGRYFDPNVLAAIPLID